MTRNQSFKRFLSGTIGAVMFLSSLPGIAANAVVGTTVLMYDDYEVSYAVTNEWEGGRNVLITVTNLSDESLYNWAFKYDEAGTMENLYNAVVFDNEDTQYVIKNNGWNFEIAPQRSVSFGYTVHGDELTVPSEFELCSERIDVTEGYEVEVEYVDTWNDGMRGEIIVTNTTEEPLEAWTLAFDTNFQIEYVWNGRAVDTDGNHYVITSEAWTQYLAPGESKSIGFVGTIEPGTDPEFSNYALSAVKINGIEEEGPNIDIDMDTDNIDLGYIEDLIAVNQIEVNFDENSQVRAIDGKFTNKPLNSAEDAAAILNCAHTLFGDNFHADAEDIEVQTNEDETFYRYTPSVNGVAAPGSQIIISAKDGEVTGLTSSYKKATETMNTTPAISSEEAVNVAFESLFAEYPEYVSAVVEASGLTEDEVKEIFKNSFEVTAVTSIIPTANMQQTLIWQVKLVNNNELTADTVVDMNDVNDYAKYLFSFINREYYIYADGEKAGTILTNSGSRFAWTSAQAHGEDLKGVDRTVNAEKDDDGYYRTRDAERNIETYRTETRYFFIGSQTICVPMLPGTMYRYSSDNIVTPKAVSAHYNMEKIYDYYKTNLSRNSYNGYHAPIKVSLGYRETTDNYDNAFWDPDRKQFVFGETTNYQYEAALDVMAHEFTHAVSGNIVNLYYVAESGALNEAYSDILGSLIEGKGKSSSGFDTIGEDAGDPNRCMSDPKSYIARYEDGTPILATFSGDSISYGPDTGAQIPLYAAHVDDMSDPIFLASLALAENYDNLGVHTFSTIFSHAAYEMINDPATSSITEVQWAKVFYNSLFRLSSGADFWDARYAVIITAKKQGFSDAQIEAMEKAFDDVGITEPGFLRIVLRWGSTPRDLDSHLTGPAVSGSGRFHTYYGQKHYYQDGSYNDANVEDTVEAYLAHKYAAELDYDDTDSYGPEITTIHAFTPGDYYFYVHDFTNLGSTTSTALSESDVTVTIYVGSSDEIMRLSDGSKAEFKISSSQAGTLWKVCKISCSASAGVSVSKVDTLSFATSASSIGS